MRPGNIDDIEKEHPIEPPELWLSRLPVRKDEDHGGLTHDAAAAELSLFSFESPDTPDYGPGPILFPDWIEDFLSLEEKAYIFSPSNRKMFTNLAFGQPVGNPAKGFFCDAEKASDKSLSSLWPDRFEFISRRVKNETDNTWQVVLHGLITGYPITNLANGTTEQASTDKKLKMQFESKYVTEVELEHRDGPGLTPSIGYMKLVTNDGHMHVYGSSVGGGVQCLPPEGFQGLVGFYGARDEKSIYRLGPIWRRKLITAKND